VRAGCELCEAARFTTWYHEDELCWVADCEACDVPMVVWRSHGAEPPREDVDHMLGHLQRVAAEHFGPEGYVLDTVMRQVPDHFHAHARRRFGRGS
jgi:hypothetical protein